MGGGESKKIVTVLVFVIEKRAKVVVACLAAPSDPSQNQTSRQNRILTAGLHGKMVVVLHLLSTLFFVFSRIYTVKATALTTALAANERLCFYADVDKAGEKIGVSEAINFYTSTLQGIN